MRETLGLQFKGKLLVVSLSGRGKTFFAGPAFLRGYFENESYLSPNSSINESDDALLHLSTAPYIWTTQDAK